MILMFMLVLMLMILGIILGFMINVIVWYYLENKMWNKGYCSKCKAKWTSLKHSSTTSIYTCNCDFLVFRVKNA